MDLNSVIIEGTLTPYNNEGSVLGEIICNNTCFKVYYKNGFNFS